MRTFWRSLWYEQDGDLNPGWFLFLFYSAVGGVGCLAALVVAVANPAAGALLIPAALGFIAFAMLTTAVIVVPIARAKLLAPHIGKATEAIKVQPPYPEMDVNERGDGD